MQSIAFFNNKGGVGKTTLLCNVAAYLAQHLSYKVLVVDADPQCNATQLMLDEESVIELYETYSKFTIHSIVHPLSVGIGYTKSIQPLYIDAYGVDLLPGDPRLALKEDLLSKDWQDATGGDIRGLRTSYLFSDLLEKCAGYDFVLFDMGPSLGSINRAVLLSADFFVSPMSIDIFSLKAIENISIAIQQWRSKLKNGISQVDSSLKDDVPQGGKFDIKFAGYVSQQYIQKTSKGQKRAVAAYDKIMKRIPGVITESFVKGLSKSNTNIRFEVGAIPNLYSLIPLSQTARKPIFGLKARDGVRGAHFNKVRDAESIFANVCAQLLSNLEQLGQE